MKGCFFIKESEIEHTLYYFYGNGRKEKLQGMMDMCRNVITEKNLEENREFLKDCEVLFCTWFMALTPDQLREYFPNLKVIFHAGASALYHAEEYMKQGVRVVTSRHAMAHCVAQFAVAMITLANKGVLLSMDLYKQKGYKIARNYTSRTFPGTYHTPIGILGAGAIGTRVIELLRPYMTEVLLYDPFVTPEKAAELGVRKASLEVIFSECQTISNHMPNKAETTGILDYSLFSKMKPNGAFVNTGRGAQVNEADLVRALTEEPERCAIIDVTHPEPVADDHPFLTMPNVFMSPHIAGFAANEVSIVADSVIDEFIRYRDGLPLRHEITLDILSTLASEKV